VKLTVLAMGTRMPAWVEAGVGEYCKRLPPELKIDIRELPLANRGNQSQARAVALESATIRGALKPRDRLVVLDVEGRSFSTEALAKRLEDWQMSGNNVSLVIGGPDGVEESLLREAELCWSLSPLTLPHPLVRVVLVEQLYRAWTINAGHPYHRN
jgi:23S rRNA (pseudouridine1915-N3)-methyltransferase